jgi:hypothetical protein
MKQYGAIILAITFSILITSFNIGTSTDEDIPYPVGYRSWTHVKSGILEQDHPNINYRGFNHFYANDQAVTGYQSGNFPEGSVLVVEVIEAHSKGENYIGEGTRHHMDVMLKDSTNFKATGGWGYAQFEKDNSPRMLTLDQKKTCYNCHVKQKDHVFSEMRK